MLQKSDIKAEPRQETQRRIIEAAAAIFAESGYRHTTIRAICGRAGVNVAAVNYHFGGKKNLYLAVLKSLRASVLAQRSFNLDDRSGPPGERLSGFIRAFLFSVLEEGDGARLARIMAQELIQPGDGFDQVVENVIKPIFTFLSATVRQLFKNNVSEQKVGLCCLSIVGQIFHFYMAKHVVRKLFYKGRFESGEIEEFALHVTRFSLYAIDRMAAEEEG